MKFLILAAVAAVASANTVARCADECKDFVPIKFEDECIVVVDGPNDRKEYTLGLGDCEEAVNFFYDAESKQIKTDVAGKCLSAIKVDDVVVPGLAACKDKAEKQWVVVDGDRWLNEKTCECLDVEDGDLVFGDCEEAPKCAMADLPKPVEPKCKAPASTCGTMPACPATCSCQADKCVAEYQCLVNANCAYGQVCNNGWCVYPKPTCSAANPCPAPYVCDLNCGQCYLPAKCPPGFEQEGPWCVPIKPECGRHHPCPNGYVCCNGKCLNEQCKKDADCLPGFNCIDGVCMVVDPVAECYRDADCADNQVCTNEKCVAAPACLPGCLGNCIHGQCVPKCTRDQQCADNEACEGGICVVVDCSDCPADQCNHGVCPIPCPNGDADCPSTDACVSGTCVYQSSCDSCFSTCDHGVCPGPNDGRRAAGVIGWF